MGSPDQFQVEVARLALAAARQHGFALAGGQALIAHGVVARRTYDVDLFTDVEGAVQAAAGVIADALASAGLSVTEIPETSELGEMFDGFERDLVEFEVRRGEQQVRLQLVRFDRIRSPVVMDIGPVLHLDDVIGSKVAAMAVRAEPRDFVDVASALDRFSRGQLIHLGMQSDPALTAEEFADAMRRLDRLDDAVFALYGLSREQARHVHARFADWPRSE